MIFLKITNIPRKYKHILNDSYVISAVTSAFTNKKLKYLVVNSDNMYAETDEIELGTECKYRTPLLVNQDYANVSYIPVLINIVNKINYHQTWIGGECYEGVIDEESMKDLKDTMKLVLKEHKKFKELILE